MCCDTICIFYHVSKLDFGDLGLNNGPQTPEEMRRKGKPVCARVIFLERLEDKQIERLLGGGENSSNGTQWCSFQVMSIKVW